VILEDKKIIFIHIPRTSGSSIETFFGVHFDAVSVYQKHLRASSIKKQVKSEWDSYFKFSIVRNPFDRVVSMYHMQCFSSININSGKSLRFFIENYQPAHHEEGSTCSDYIDEKIDFIGRFEFRDETIKLLSEKTGININNNFKFDPDKTPENRQHYSTYFDKRSADLVRSKYQDDFLRFGYSMDL
jgi:hypothetical protein